MTTGRRPVRTWVIIETILAVVAVPLGGFMAMMSVMMFDAPGSTENPAVILLFSSVVGFPLACIVAVIAAWIAIARARDRGALWLSLLPVLPIVSGVVALVWLQVRYGGQFGG
jgi:hypothetical protein